MADRDYVIHYKADTGQALAAIRALAAELTRVDALATAVGPKLQGLGRGVARNLNSTNQAAGNLAGNLQNLQAHAQGAGGALQGVGGHLKGINAHLAPAATHAGALDSSLAALIARAAAMGLLRKAVGELGDAIREAREHREETAEKNLTNRDKARELANLIGEEGPNDRTMARVFGVGLQSGLNFDESIKFLEQFEGSIPAGIKKGHVREDQKPSLAAVGARAGVRLGLDPGTAGDLAGTIAQHVDLNNQRDADGKLMTAEEALAAQFEAMAFGANEGRGQVSVLMRGELAGAASAVPAGRVASMAEMGAFVGTASTISKTGAFAGTKFSQLDNALNRVDGEAGEFLKESGVAAVHGDRAKLHKLKEHVDAARAASADPATFDANAYLAEHGFAAQADRTALVGFLENVDVLDKTAEAAERRALDGKGALAKDETFQHTLDAENRRSVVRNEAADFAQGKKFEALMVARRNAVARLKAQGTFKDQEQLFTDKLKGGFGLDEFLGLPSGLQRRIDEEVAADVRTQAANAGVDLVKEGLASSHRTQESSANDGLFVSPEGDVNITDLPAAVNRVRGAGGDSGGGAGIEAQIRSMDRDPAKQKAADAARDPRGAAAGDKQARLDAGEFKQGVGEFRQVVGQLASALRDSGGGGGALPDVPQLDGPWRA